jgi:hypothetical protein
MDALYEWLQWGVPKEEESKKLASRAAVSCEYLETTKTSWREVRENYEKNDGTRQKWLRNVGKQNRIRGMEPS